jgi:hypothetical protein
MTSRLIAFIDSHGLTWQGYLAAEGGETTDSILGWTEAR